MKSLFYLLLILFLSLIASYKTFAQSSSNRADSLKTEILNLNSRINNIEMNLGKTHRQFKLGAIVAAIGYSVTVTGGLIGGNDPQLSQALLGIGGGIGFVGTLFIIDSYKYLGRIAKRKKA